MEKRSLKYLAAACGGELVQGGAAMEAVRVCTDSRQAQPGDLFIALAGERFDAHDFLPAVMAKKVTAVMVNAQRIPAAVAGVGVIAVTDTKAALGKLAARYRQDFAPYVVAVAGSNGKTTTKELIASVLRQRFATLWSEASFNNDVGVPVTLLNLEARHQAAVFEVGTNHPGELAPLVGWIAPRYGVITSIGREHLEFFHDLAGVAKEEGALAEGLPEHGVFFVNGDTAEVPQLVRRARCRVVRVGLGADNDWRATAVTVTREGTVFSVAAPKSEFNGEYQVGLLGRHQATNALLALALGAELGLSRAEIAQGLAACAPAKMRLQPSEVNGLVLINDAYNANADSMAAALQTLADLQVRGRRVAVLGDMAELGAESAAAHEDVGRCAARLGLDVLVTVGEQARGMAQAARAAGLPTVLDFGGTDEASLVVRGLVRPGDAVLVKASRSARLERVCEALAGQTKPVQ